MKPVSDIALILKAASFAAHKNRDQRRKDANATPYINHPLALASVLADEAGITDAEVLAAALLHDTIEDTLTGADELRAAFGERITSIVEEVTDDKSLDKAERKRLQEVDAPSKSREAKLVKLADKICNLRDLAASPPRDWDLARRREYFDWARRVMAGLRGTHAGLEALYDRAAEARP